MNEAVFQAGAALAMLDLRMRADVRAQVPFAGAWRRRLALKADVRSVVWLPACLAKRAA
jgi:hypothetical protein